MTEPVGTFFAKVTDEYGGEYPDAFLAVREHSESAQTTSRSETCEGVYVTESRFEAITYKVNYWYTDQTKAEGKRSRPLLNDSDGVFTDVFVVDLDNPQVSQILDSDLQYDTKIIEAIAADVRRKFS